jgi:hypothetical protein
VPHAHYDGVANDLLTAGLGKTGLRQRDAARPWPIRCIRLRRNCAGSRFIQQLLRPHRPDAGRRLWHAVRPNVTANGTVTTSEG